MAGKPVCVFATSGSPGVCKAAINVNIFQTDNALLGMTLCEEKLPLGSDRPKPGQPGRGVCAGHSRISRNIAAGLPFCQPRLLLTILTKEFFMLRLRACDKRLPANFFMPHPLGGWRSRSKRRLSRRRSIRMQNSGAGQIFAENAKTRNRQAAMKNLAGFLAAGLPGDFAFTKILL
ncbi:MAG: hypothetical protein ONB51_01675 [candidate division KSB1 bacterium]|nr:hypothetical protein [candidate division KSB1 bacterium]MDZ7298124.1 hypothetical protein [candidate division KSB1 bacterium]MDZ7309259.1 hypothetical protein [candidate division KSB1 bacterium]MDZ7407930.1 hypothetical protein [candidate division KSB1 bacterium]